MGHGIDKCFACRAGTDPGRGSMMILDPDKIRLGAFQLVTDFNALTPQTFNLLTMRRMHCDTRRNPFIYPFVNVHRAQEEKLVSYRRENKAVKHVGSSVVGPIDWLMRQE